MNGSHRRLRRAGHEVIVADPNYAPMYGALHRTIKTDRRDVAALAEANRRGWYRAAHRTSAAQRATRQLLRTRRQLVQMRSGAVALLRSLRETRRLSPAGVRGRAGARAARRSSRCRRRSRPRWRRWRG